MNSKYSLFAGTSTSLIVFIISILASQAASGQELKTRAVARLLTEPAESLSRPRRVSEVTVNTEPSLGNASATERSAFEQTNAARVSQGLAPLVWAADLCRMARLHSQNMATQGYFAHETPDGLDLTRRARAVGVGRFKVIAENIAYNKGYEDPGAFAVQRWLMSSAHRANILDAEFEAAAIGSYVAADGSVYLTQVFIAR